MSCAKPILVVGSVNADSLISTERLPTEGETITAQFVDGCSMVPGGKGANQAVAVARLSQVSAGAPQDDHKVKLVCMFGNDANAAVLRSVLSDNSVDISDCPTASAPSGTGLVFLQPNGNVSSVVIGGSNLCFRKPGDIESSTTTDFTVTTELLLKCSAVMLQRELPEHVNEVVAQLANIVGVPVIQDAGGEDRVISDELLGKLSYISPNSSELARLTGLRTDTDEEVLRAAKQLSERGAKNVLVTLGERGSLLLTETGEVLRQASFVPPGGKVVDETAAGDSFRAAFAVALMEGRPVEKALMFASAAGAIACSRLGAIPSIPFRAECEQLLEGANATASTGPVPGSTNDAKNDVRKDVDKLCNMKFASRLNSMGARLDLWKGENTVLGWVARQGTIKGLDLVDFNFPQHLEGLSVDSVRDALEAAGLKTGAVCLRYPKRMQLGSFTNPDPRLRQEAISLTKDACQWALDLGADEVVVWSAFDGYDYNLQADYTIMWNRMVEAFREVCDEYPNVKVSLEFKPTDENTRYFAVPSTGAALLLVNQIDRPNMGLTLDIGHCLMAGENPAQSAAMVGTAKKLFGVQLNDGHSKLGAEDGLMFGSVHPTMALDFVLWLQKTDFPGHIYFDTFPRNEDPVRECEYNIRRFKSLWERAAKLRAAGLEEHLGKHDALAVLEMLEQSENGARLT